MYFAAKYCVPHMGEGSSIASYLLEDGITVLDEKPVIISETGWPNIGTPTDGSVPSLENAMKYFIDTCQWAEEDGVEVFYFSSFDESWKVGAEGDVGAYWGLWDKDGKLKYA